MLSNFTPVTSALVFAEPFIPNIEKDSKIILKANRTDTKKVNLADFVFA